MRGAWLGAFGALALLAVAAVARVPMPVGSPGAAPATVSSDWRTYLHEIGSNEANLAVGGDGAMYVLLVPVGLGGLTINRSDDAGVTWSEVFPESGQLTLALVTGLEGDLAAFGKDVVYVATNAAGGVSARSEDGGWHWKATTITGPGSDQAWVFLGPTKAHILQSKPYALAAWFRIGPTLTFSFDGGATWGPPTVAAGADTLNVSQDLQPVTAPLGINPDYLDDTGLPGPLNPACIATARPPGGGAPRVAGAGFAGMRAGLHGGWGTDGAFYWAEYHLGSLYVCRYHAVSGIWDGTVLPVHDVPLTHRKTTHLAFDERGTLYVLQANRLYVSLDRGHSFAYHHALDVWGDYPNSTDHANQAFAVAGGEGHFAFRTADGCVTYRHAQGLDGPQPSWGKPECVRATNDSRIDFPQIALGPGGIPTLGYGVGDPNLGAAQAWAATSTRLLPP